MSSNTKYLQKDVQKSTDGFPNLPIKKVGVRHIKAPISVRVKDTDDYAICVADISGYCNLEEDLKGINMSRFARTLFAQCNAKPLKMDDIFNVTRDLIKAHESKDMYLKISFEYIMNGCSPVSKLPSFEYVKCCIESVIVGDNARAFLTISTNESSCCPCSKEMSKLSNNLSEKESEELTKLSSDLQAKIDMAGFGAHNQRSNIEIKVELMPDVQPIWIEDLVTIAQQSASAQTFNVLKRPDEKWVTEAQYLGGYFDENLKFNKIDGAGPKFCEDIARATAQNLKDKYLDKSIKDFVVIVENEESIHTTLTACAVITAGRTLE